MNARRDFLGGFGVVALGVVCGAVVGLAYGLATADPDGMFYELDLFVSASAGGIIGAITAAIAYVLRALRRR